MIRFHDSGEVYDDSPPLREPQLPMCRFCQDREIMPDGHHGWVHADDFKYQCDMKSKNSSMAAPRAGSGEHVR